MPEHAPGAAPGHRLRYDGRLGDLYRIFFLNLLLTVLTLGIWRFWARTRLRRHVWQHLSLDGQRLEYTGTGGELFRGFLLALLVIVPLLFAMGLTQMLAPEAARLASFALYLPAGLLGFAQPLRLVALRGQADHRQADRHDRPRQPGDVGR